MYIAKSIDENKLYKMNYNKKLKRMNKNRNYKYYLDKRRELDKTMLSGRFIKL